MYRLTRLLCGHSPPLSIHRLRSYHTSRLISLASSSPSSLPQHHHSTPSLTTNVLLTNLSTKVIENDLIEALKETKIQRVQLQPGISIHLLSEQDVELAASVLDSKFNFKSFVSSAMLPSLTLQNLPKATTSESLSASFSAYNPEAITIDHDASSSSILLRFSPEDGDDIQNRLEELISSLQRHPDLIVSADIEEINKPAVFFRNISHLNEIQLQELIANYSDSIERIQMIGKAVAKDKVPSMAIAYFSKEEDALDCVRTLHNTIVGEDRRKISVSYRETSEPAIELSNLPNDITHEELMELCSRLSTSEIIIHRAADVVVEDSSAVVLEETHSITEHSTQNEVVTHSITEQSIEEAVAAHPHHQSIVEEMDYEYEEVLEDSYTSATIILETPKEASIAEFSLDKTVLNGYQVSAALKHFGDVGITIKLPNNNKKNDDDDVKVAITVESASAAVKKVLEEMTLTPKSISIKTNMMANIGFLTKEQSRKAYNSFMLGHIKLLSTASNDTTSIASTTPTTTTSTVATPATEVAVASHPTTTHSQQHHHVDTTKAIACSIGGTIPSFVLEVLDVPSDCSADSVIAVIKEQLPAVHVLKVDRNAMVKFRRHKEVVPGMKALKKLSIHGMPMKVQRYRPLNAPIDSEYDEPEGRMMMGRGKHSGTEGQSSMESFNRFSLEMVLKDCLELDPAVRYQIAKNAFERALFDAIASEDIGDLYDLDMHPEIEEEVVDLITIIADSKKEMTTTTMMQEIDPPIAAATQRLFEIFIQTEDMSKYTKDFNEFAAVLGNPNTDDPFDWSQFDLQTDKDLKRLSAEMLALEQPQREEQREMARMMKMMKQRGDDDEGDDDDDDDEEGEYGDGDDDAEEEEEEEDDDDDEDDEEDSSNRLEVNEDNEEKDFDRRRGSEEESSEGMEKLDVFTRRSGRRNRPFDDDINDQSSSGGFGDKSMDEFISSKMNTDENLNLKFNHKFELQDEDGNIWSACLLDTDVVQKVTPGQRVNSFRALTVIGNGKGAAGFAMGKGKSGPEALYSACRNSLRNLTHIDLYDNGALAVDLTGRYNGCFVYIRATNINRAFVGSPFAEAVLSRFGISSASVRIVGNRNPYSVVRAMFKAIEHHENIDEIARDRGQRYLTLRWALKNMN